MGRIVPESQETGAASFSRRDLKGQYPDAKVEHLCCVREVRDDDVDIVACYALVETNEGGALGYRLAYNVVFDGKPRKIARYRVPCFATPEALFDDFYSKNLDGRRNASARLVYKVLRQVMVRITREKLNAKLQRGQ